MKSIVLIPLVALLVQTVPQSGHGIPGVVADGVTPQLVKEGFVFTEGPLGMADGGLLFSEIMGPSRIHHLDSSGKISVLYERTKGANGLAFTRTGNLVSAEGDGQTISRRGKDGQAVVLTSGAPDRQLLAPNDLITDAKGGIYFTDPGPRPVVPRRTVYVYYLPAGAKQPLVLDDRIARPNGLTLTGNGRTLIVDDTLGTTVYAFDVQPDGTVKNKRPFAELHDIPSGQESVADGMALDREDRIYVSSLTGVQVFDKGGKYLGTIHVPRQPANVAFAGPNKRTLFITAREGLYRLPMLAQGPERLGK